MMKPCLIALAVTSLISCNGSSQQTTQQKEIEPNWRVAQITTQEHSYNKSGLLDTTRRTEDIYVNGVSGVVMNFIITRNYDKKNNKIVERTFQALKRENKLFDEVVYKYDSNNNPMLITDKVEDSVSEIIQNTYNNKNQKTEEISIHKKFQQHPWDGNLDSAFAHRNDKEIPRYDTLIISYKYDKEGNLINQLYKSSGGEIGETVTTLYSGRQKMLSYSSNSKGDTVTRINYLKNGNLITEIKEDPLSSDTSLFEGDKLIQKVTISKTSTFNSKETFKYDDKGNVIEDVKYK